jgi:hypothetical protein
MSINQILSIIGNNIPDIEKTEYFSTIALINKESWTICGTFTDQVASYLSSIENTIIKITKISNTKAMMNRKMSTNPTNNLTGIYEVDLLHGIIKLTGLINDIIYL